MVWYVSWCQSVLVSISEYISNFRQHLISNTCRVGKTDCYDLAVVGSITNKPPKNLNLNFLLL